MTMEQNWNCLLFALKNIFSSDTDGRLSLTVLKKRKRKREKVLIIFVLCKFIKMSIYARFEKMNFNSSSKTDLNGKEMYPR